PGQVTHDNQKDPASAGRLQGLDCSWRGSPDGQDGPRIGEACAPGATRAQQRRWVSQVPASPLTGEGHMNSRERIRALIAKEPADRHGFWLGNPYPDTWPILHDYFGTSTEEELRVRLGDDFRW